jgi:hypothetical protein
MSSGLDIQEISDIAELEFAGHRLVVSQPPEIR